MSLIVVPLPSLPSSAGRIVAIRPLPNRVDRASASAASMTPADTASPVPLAEQSAGSFSPCKLLAVNDRAELLQVSPLQGGTRFLSALQIPEFDPFKPIQIVVDPDGRYAAVSNRYGRHAAVFALPRGKNEQTSELLKLERGDYYTDKSRFPLAFAQPDNRTLLIHGSDWNRVELTELPSLRTLAARAFPDRDGAGDSVESDTPPLPFLNYFHGGLIVSPDGGRVADTGWVWQPVGLLGAWSLREWLDDPHESENGQSLKHFFQTEDWDLPAVWIDGERLAVWGRVDADLLDEEDWQEIGDKPAIVIYDTRSGLVSRVARDVPPYLLSTAFAPSSECFPYPLGDMAFAENRLLFWGRGVPLHVWKLPAAEAASSGLADPRPEPAAEAAFHDAVYHSGADLFIELDADGNLRAFRLCDDPPTHE